MSAISAAVCSAFKMFFHFCVRLRGKIEPEHVVTVVALLVTSKADNPTMMAVMYMIIATTHTASAWRAESRAKADRKEIHKLEKEVETEEKVIEKAHG